MTVQYVCDAEGRRAAVSASATLNGIDYLEVSADQLTLTVTFLHAQGLAALTPANVVVEGGVRITGIKVGSVSAAGSALTVSVAPPGDYSSYRLRLIDPNAGETPPTGFDPQLSSIDFSFKASCPNEFDCRTDSFCPPDALAEPELDYLAKDYTSFRKLMLDRLAALLPTWTERNPADAHVALVELLAYIGDQLSYYQDSVATEAYLGTARKRISLRRHARLLDYQAHAGCNARAWVAFEVAAGPLALPAGTRLLTGDIVDPPSLPPELLERELKKGPLVFETLFDATLRAAHNEVTLYTWSDDECCLPKGATRVTLLDDPPGSLVLSAGDVLMLEPARDQGTGQLKPEPDPGRSHPVRLTSAVQATDPLDGTGVVEVAWADDDALPFALCISAVVEPPGQPARLEPRIGVARANVVLADHGLSIAREPDPAEPLVPALVPDGGPYRPQLAQAPVTFACPVDPTAPAAAAGPAGPRSALPSVRVEGEARAWNPVVDLLGSLRFDPVFAVETDDDGTGHLRFGDDEHGEAPEAGFAFAARYRVGNGSAGNVGAGALRRAVLPGSGVSRVWNPLPAAGGVDPEPLERIRLYAPDAFRTQERAVTESDYATVAERQPDVQRAAARFRWTGSWYTAFVSADRSHGAPTDPEFVAAVTGLLDGYRMAGHDLDVEQPELVPLDIGLEVCVSPGHFRTDVEAALLRELGARVLPDGRRGFFDPDNFTFGQPVYLSQIFARAIGVAGVRWVQAYRFQRYGKTAAGELESEVFEAGPREIVRLENDPSFPENGRLELTMKGGT